MQFRGSMQVAIVNIRAYWCTMAVDLLISLISFVIGTKGEQLVCVILTENQSQRAINNLLLE